MRAVRRWLRRAMLATLVLLFVMATAWLIGREQATRWLAATAERSLEAALHAPVRLEEPRLALLPPTLAIARVSVGDEGAVAHLRDLAARLELMTSVATLRPTVAVSGSELFVDLTRFPSGGASGAGEEDAAAPPPRLPPFALSLDLDGAQVHLDGQRDVRLREAVATAATPRGGLALTLRAADLELATDEQRVVVDSVDVAAAWRDGLWRVGRGELHGPALRIDVEGEAEPLGHHVAVEADLQQLSEVLPERWRARGKLTAQLELRGDLADPGGQATLRIDDPALAGVQARRVDLSAGRADGVVTVAPLRLDLGDGSLELRGELREEKHLPVRATLRLDEVDSNVIEPLVGTIDQAAARLSGELEVDGVLDPLGGTVSGKGTLAPRGGARWSWTTTVKGGADSGTLRLAAQRQGGGEVVADARLATDGSLQGTARVDVADLAPLSELLAAVAPAAVLPTAGSATIDATLAGSLRQPSLEAAVRGDSIMLHGSEIKSLEAQLRVDEKSLEVRRARLGLTRGEVEASGVFALAGTTENDWRAGGTGIDTGWLLGLLAELDVLPAIPVSGLAAAAVRASGTWDDLVLEGDAAIPQGALAGEPLRQLRADFAVRGKTWRVGADAQGDGDALLHASASGDDAGLELAVNGSGWDLAALDVLEGSELGGVAALEAEFSGPPGALNGAADLRIEGLQAGGTAVGGLDASATARAGQWEIEARALEERLSLQASLDATPELPLRLEASWREVDAARLLGAPADFSALLSGSAELGGPLRNPKALRGQVEISAARLAHGAEDVTARRPIELRWADGELQIEPFELSGAESQVSGRGRVTADGAVEVSLSGEASLSWLEAVIGPPLESADGDLRFDVGLRRAAGAQPVVTGAVRIAGGALDFGDTLALSGISAEVALANRVVTVQSLTAQTGGGTVTVSGAVDLVAGPDLKWRIREVALAPVRALEIELRGSGHLRGAWDTVELGGEIEVVQLLYDRDLEFTDLIPSFNRALRPARKSASGRPPIRLNLRVTAADSLYVENNIARLEGAADVLLRGTFRKPTLKGDVRIVDGVIRLRGREFEVVNGSLSFRPTLGEVAAIDFKAESVIDTEDESYGVGVRVSGFTNDYRVSLTSTDGGLSQTDVASLITFGKTVSQLQRGGSSGGSGVSLDTLVGLAGNNLGGRLADRAEEILPFDQIEFRPQFSTTTGQFEPEVRVGKNLSEDLSAWIGQTFGVQSRTTLEAEYRLSARIATALLWESSTASEQGAIGGEARFRRDFWRIGQLLFFGLGN